MTHSQGFLVQPLKLGLLGEGCLLQPCHLALQACYLQQALNLSLTALNCLSIDPKPKTELSSRKAASGSFCGPCIFAQLRDMLGKTRCPVTLLRMKCHLARSCRHKCCTSWWPSSVRQACLLCEQGVAGLQTACFVGALLLAESVLELVGAHARQQPLQLTHSVGF